ncbi:collagen-like triple helix repeat-containing protein [Maribacter halichondriae]|uniref:collagen-like triple helix repeat-containing protein n=1 Tax=Maribacter halichondriae TaxID=2980554 RepID=UPI0023596210|nr:collagen-like protein [Maribacter sp. Hal144]
MKKITIVLGAFLTLFFVACEGPQGPPGFDGFDGLDGLDGQDGINILGKVIDIEGDFTAENEYSIFFEFPQTIEVFETDVVLVYILWDQIEDSNGDPVDVWRLLPQTRILDQGLLQYNYDHTFFDVNLFLESDFDLTTLQPGDTDNQVFRIAVLPAETLSGSKIDKSNIEGIMGMLNMNELDVQKISLD